MTTNRGMQISLAAAIFAVGGLAPAQQVTAAQQDQRIHVNQIQVIGSHNSYHAGFPPSARKLMELKSPDGLHGLDYHHAPLTDQLSGGVRQIEIDVYADTKGGRYAHPAILNMVAKAGLPADPEFDPQHVMDKPGFKVLHMQDIDVRSTCMTLVACLTDVRGWSKQHPQHLPIFILIETKEGKDRHLPHAVTPESFTAPVFDALDKEIRSVFTPDEMITPDDVRGGSATLVEAVPCREMAYLGAVPWHSNLFAGPETCRAYLYKGASIAAGPCALYQGRAGGSRRGVHGRERRIA